MNWINRWRWVLANLIAPVPYVVDARVVEQLTEQLYATSIQHALLEEQHLVAAQAAQKATEAAAYANGFVWLYAIADSLGVPSPDIMPTTLEGAKQLAAEVNAAANRIAEAHRALANARGMPAGSLAGMLTSISNERDFFVMQLAAARQAMVLVVLHQQVAAGHKFSAPLPGTLRDHLVRLLAVLRASKARPFPEHTYDRLSRDALSAFPIEKLEIP